MKYNYFIFEYDLFGVGWFMLNIINDELQFTILNRLDRISLFYDYREHTLERCGRYV